MKSRAALLLIVIVYLISFSHYKNYRSFLQGGGDSWGYYAYLPAIFIYHDVDDLQQTIAKRAEYNGPSVRKLENGYLQIEEAHAYGQHTIIKYTYGVALLNSPFFLLAHTYCQLTGAYAADGYTLPYNLMTGVATLLYSIVGLWLIRKMLQAYFSDTIVSLVVLVTGLGTNLYFFSVSHLGMSHPYLFALYALCLFASDRFYRTQKWIDAFLIGFCGGMITLIRPNETIIVLFPLLWNVFSVSTAKARWTFIREHRKKYFIAALIFAACMVPQIAYWKILTGHWVFYSYTQEGFDFTHPHLKNGLFGFANGWLSYTPVMSFAVFGLFLLPRYFKQTALASYLFLPVFIYVIYSWWCWQYINGFGSRPMIETYPIWAFPLACFFVYLSHKTILRMFSFAIIAFLIFLNCFQTWQFEEGWIWTEDSNRAYYKAIFLKTSSTYEAHVAYDCGETQPDTNRLQQVRVLKTLTFDDTTAGQPCTIRRGESPAILLQNGTSPVIHLSAEESGAAPQDYFKISCWAYCPELQYDHYKQAVLTAEFKHGGNQIRWRSVRLQTKIGNSSHKILDIGKAHQWQQIWFFVRAPHRFNGNSDELNVMVWNPGIVPILIDDVQVELWRKK